MSKIILLGLDGACPDIISAEMADGRLPNFRKLRESGVSADNLPFPSAVTPGNWTSIASGTKPWTHGISDFCMHTPGAPLSEKHMVFKKGSFNSVQLIWDALASRGRRTATFSFPGSLPQTEPLHLAVGNSGEPAENASPWTIAPSRALVAGCAPAGPYGWREHEIVELQPSASLPVKGFVARWQLNFQVKGTNCGYGGAHDFTLYLGTHANGPGIMLRDGETLHVLPVNTWSPWLERSFIRDLASLQEWVRAPLKGDSVMGEFRVRLTRLNLDRPEFLLYLSPIYPKYDFSSDPETTRPLRDAFGPYSDNLVISRLLMEWLDPEGFRDEFRLQGVWQARAMLELVNRQGYDCVFSKWHAFDKFYHFFMHKIDPSAPGFEPQSSAFYENLHRIVLGIADEMVGIVLAGLKPDTSLVVISDHGLMASRCCVWVNRFLAQNGFIAFKAGKDGRTEVDWSRTRAYVSSFLLLNVNLKGRETEGIVAPGREYEETKRTLIALLRDWKDPANGQHVMSDVFDPKTDGAFYGLGSKADGDVRYFTNAGYTLFRSISPFGDQAITDVKGPHLGDHGSCQPTTRFSRGGEIGLFFAAGRGFRKGYRRPFPLTPDSVVPTLLEIAGEKPLSHQEGAVAHDLIATEFRKPSGA